MNKTKNPQECNKKEMIISTAEHYGKIPNTLIYTHLYKRVLGASLITDAWSYINI